MSSRAFKVGHGATDATYPHSLAVANGVVYGVTGLGGAKNMGTFYSLTPGNGTWTETVLCNFAGGATNGSGPGGDMTPDGSGGYYIVTKLGGGAGDGTVVDVVPANSGFTDRLIYSFPGGANGTTPCCGLVPAGNGMLYGVTAKGGAHNAGTFFSLTP